MVSALPYYDADAVMALGYAGATDAIVHALRDGIDPAAGHARTGVDLAHGQMLLMPAETTSGTGIKVVTIAPSNPERGLPLVHAQYLLFDRATLAPTAVLDGTALTTLRTPSVSVAAVRQRLPDRPLHLVVIGHGPQAQGHVAAFAAARPHASATYLVRDPSRAPVEAEQLGTDAARDQLRAADVIVCATSARTPVLWSNDVRDDAIVVAVGAYEPDARELDAALLARSTVVVEDVATALREAGDVVLAIAEGALSPDDLLSMRDVVLGAADARGDRPLVVKTVGMAWEDLAVAEAVAS
jgi:ornithine cyclodeaminase